MNIQTTTTPKFMPLHWTNSCNASFYSKMPISYFKKKAIEGGLDNGCDVKAVIKYIKNARSILEVGAGYGRALDYIIKSGFKGELVALEREPKLCKILKKKFKQVQVICDDIRSVKFEKKFDLIIWLWTGLWEFSKYEQVPALANLVSYLNVDGFLIFDLIPITCRTINAISLDKNNKIISAPHGDDYTYTPSHTEIKQYAQRLGRGMRTITYKTKTGKTKILYIFYRITNAHTTSKKRAVDGK